MPTSTLQRKTCYRLKRGQQPGSFSARFATFLKVDQDGDVTLPGAFEDGRQVPISSYGHTSWSGALPVGRGVLQSDATAAWVDGQFFMQTPEGKSCYETVKALADLAEFSYGYEVLEASYDPAELAQFPGAERILKRVAVHEVSPVLIGAGDTALLSIKSGRPGARARALAQRLKAQAPDATTMAAIAQIDLLADQLDELVDTLMDQFGIPDPDEDLEGEPEEPKAFSIVDDAAHALAGVKRFTARVSSLGGLRARKQRKAGRVLSSANRERLAALLEALTTASADIQDLLASTDPGAGKSASDPEMEAIWLAHQQRQTQLVTSAVLEPILKE